MKLKHVKSNTKIQNLYKYQVERIVDIAIEWCMMTFGVRKWCPNVMVEIVKDEITNDAGWYSPYRHDPEITINMNANPTLIDLIDTLIHEYTHYLQPNFQKTYNDLSTVYEYYNNPLEIEAIEIAKQHRHACLMYVKKKLKNR